MKNFKINGKTYQSVIFDYNLICDLEDEGIDVDKMLDRPLGLCRAYLSVCGNMTKQDAGKEIGSHLSNGGTLEELMEIIGNELTESDFFRGQSQNEEKEAPKSKAKAKQTEE